MSDKLFEIMDKYDCDIDEALEYLEREANAVIFLSTMTNPYGQVTH